MYTYCKDELIYIETLYDIGPSFVYIHYSIISIPEETFLQQWFMGEHYLHSLK